MRSTPRSRRVRPQVARISSAPFSTNGRMPGQKKLLKSSLSLLLRLDNKEAKSYPAPMTALSRAVGSRGESACSLASHVVACSRRLRGEEGEGPRAREGALHLALVSGRAGGGGGLRRP